MPIRPSSIVHALVGAGIAAAVVFAAQPPADKAKPQPPKPAPATAPAQPGEPAGMDQQKMMEQWMALMKPGKAHEMLAKRAGNWNCTLKMYMGGPGAPAQVSQGKATMKVVLNGRYLQQDFDGQMMGMPMKGTGLVTFDNFRKQYVEVWADTMGTSIMRMTGSMSPDGKTQTMFGEMDEPTMGEIGKTVKFVTRFIDDDTMNFEAWEVQYGNDFKAFEIEYTRAK